VKYKANGEVEWLKTFGTSGADDQGYWVLVNKDGGFTITGYINDLYGDGSPLQQTISNVQSSPRRVLPPTHKAHCRDIGFECVLVC
jgi:hypothetical protein